MIILGPTLIPVYAQPQPILSTPNLNYNPFSGKTVTLCLTPSNSGDQNGFRPVIELVVPVNITFQGASFLGRPVDHTTYTIPSSGNLTYHIGRYTRTVSGQPGAEVVVLMPPINNIPAGEQTPPICADLLVTDNAVIGKDHLVNSTLIFAYGTDPLDNPGVDPPEVSSPLQVTITPSLIRVRKDLSGIWSADVVPTGPNYSFNYTITVSMANVEFTDLVIKDLLPEEAIYVKLAEVRNLSSGSEVTDYEVVSEPTPGQYGGNLTIRIPKVIGNSGDTIEVKVTMYFPFYDKTGGDLIGFDTPKEVNNEVEVTANYQGNPSSATNQSKITASSMTYNKGVEIYRDNYTPGLSRYDILEYTITFWLSDYYNVSVITFSDSLGDGQRVLTNMTPVFYVSNGTSIYSGQFSPGSYTFYPDHSGSGGSTPLFFNLTKALEDQGISGDLRGGMVGNESWIYGGGDFNPPFGRGRTWGYIRFWAYIESEYNSTVPSEDQQIDSGDVMKNEVTMTSEYSEISTIPPDIGRTTSLTIERPTIEKRIAYVNGAAPPNPVYVKAGDNVTYELKVYIPTANADGLEIKDMIPLPVFRVDYNKYGQTPFTDGQLPTATIPPPPGQWTIGTEDNVTSVTGIQPILSVDATTNELVFRYDSPIHAGNNTLLVVDILYTLTATDEPYGDLLDLANLVTMSYGNSFNVLTSKSSYTLVTTHSPSLTLSKEVVASTQGTIDNGDLQGADAGDTVTFQINVTNEGHNNAHDVMIRDEIQPPGAGYVQNLQNIHVYGCDGTTEWDPSTYTLTVSPSYTNPEEINLSLNENVVLPPGSCIVLRYDLNLTQNVYPLQDLVNNGSIIRYSSVKGGENFVDPNDPPTDDAKVTVAQPSINKYLESTNQSFTPDDILAIGEEAVFGIRVTLPEGTASGLVINDTLPEGFTYESVELDSTGFGGSLPSYTTNYDPSSRNVTITFSGNVVTYYNNDPGDNSFLIKVHSRVDKDAGWTPSASTWTRTNRASMDWDGNPGPELTSTHDVEVATPKVTVTKTFFNEDYTSISSKDGGDKVILRIEIVSEGAADAFDIEVTDALDSIHANLTTLQEESRTVPPDTTVSWSTSAGNLVIEVDRLRNNTAQLSDRKVTIDFSFNLNDTVEAGETYHNTLNYEYTTLPGVSGYEKTFTGTYTADLKIKDPKLEKEVQFTSNPDTLDDDLAIREEVVFRIRVTLPEGNISDMVLEDEWPQGFGYLNYTIDSSTLNGSLPTPTVNVDEVNRKLTLEFSGWAHVNADNEPSNDYFNVTLALRVLDDSSNVGYPDKGEKVNYVSLSWDGGKQVTSQKKVYVVEPHLTLSKVFNVTVADAGDWVEATLTLANNGFSPAYEVNISDVLDGSVFDLNTVTEVSTPADFTYSFDIGTGEISYSGDRIDVGETLTFRFAAKLRDDVTTLSSYNNVANTEGSSMPNHLDGERTYSAEGAAKLDIGKAVLSKQLVDTSEPTTGNKVTIGEIVIYNLTASIPEGVTHNVTFYDILPSNSNVLMSFVNANVTTNRGGVSSSAVTLTPGSWTEITPAQTGNVLAFYLGDLTNTNDDAEKEIITVRVKLLVLNLAENQAGSQLINSFKIGYTNASNDYVYSDEVQHTLTVVEPQLWSVLTADPITVGWSGDEVVLHFNITNLDTSTSSTAYDLDILSLLPPEFSDLQVLSVDFSNAGSVTNSSTPSELNLHSSYLQPGGWINVTFRVVLQPNAVFGQRIEIEACANGTTTPGEKGSWNEIPGDPGDQNGERIGNGVSPNDIRACDSASVTVGTPNVEKDVLTPKVRYAPGDQVRYQITIGTPKGSTGDLKVTDTLAEGLLYSDDLYVEVPSGVTFSNTPGESPPFFSHTDTGTTEILVFDFGSFINSNSGGVNTYIRFSATVEDHADNVDGRTLSNEALLTYLDSDSNEKDVGPASVTITVGEPELSDLSKTNLSDLRGGQVSWFLLSFRNSGSTTAYDTNVTDVLPPELRGDVPEVSYVKVGDRTLSPSDYDLEYYETNGTLKVHLITPSDDSSARIEPGELVEIKIGARALPHVPLSYGAVNSFSVRYSSRPGAPDEERTYSAGPASATVYSQDPEVSKVVLSTETPPPDPSDPTRCRARVDEIIMYNVTFRMPQGTWAEDVEFHDTIPDGLEVINATAKGINATGLVTGTTSITESGGRYTVTAAFGKLVDAEVNVTIYARVKYYYSGGTPVRAGDVLIDGNESNPSYYSWSNGVETKSEYSNEVMTEIIKSEANLTISKSFDPKLLRFGDITIATITIANDGNGTAYQTVLRDVFCDSFEFLNASVTPSDISGNVITWEIGKLRPGEEWTVSVAFKLSACSCFNDNATVSYVNPGDPSTTEEREARDDIEVVKGLDFVKMAEPEYLKPGDAVGFKLLVHNPTCMVIDKLNFTDELPGGLSYIIGSSKLNGTGVGDPSISDGNLTWNTSLTLNPGESYLLEFSAEVSPGTSGELTNLGGLLGIGEDGLVEVNDTASITVRGERGGILFSKRASAREVNANSTVKFTITIKNEWNVPIVDVDVWDILPCCMTFEESSPGYPEPEHSNKLPPGTGVMKVTKLPEGEAERCRGDRILKWHIDSIDPGETVTIEFEARVRCSGLLKNVAKVFYRTEGGLKDSRRSDVLILGYSTPAVVKSNKPKAGSEGARRSSEGQSAFGEVSDSMEHGSEGTMITTTVKAGMTETETSRKTVTRPTYTTSTGSGTPVTTRGKAHVAATSEAPGGGHGEIWSPAVSFALLLSAMIIILYVTRRRRARKRGGFGS